jgi:uncharacterized delta-60 repeat protein
MRLELRIWAQVALAASTAAVFGLPQAATAAEMTDPSFGQNGLSIVAPPVVDGGAHSGVWDLAASPEGKMVGALSGLAISGHFGAIRFNGDGSLDTSFGRQGFASLEVPSSTPSTSNAAEAQGLAVQADGRIVVAGYLEERTQFGGFKNFGPVLARYLPDGSPDPSFGEAGAVVPRTVRDTLANEVLHAVAVAPSGRVVAVGSRNEDERGGHFAVVTAYTPEGRLDRGFGRRGRVLIASPSRTPRNDVTANLLSGIEILPSGKILVAGYLGSRLFLARMRPNGGLDSSFGGGDGKVSIELAGRGTLRDGWWASLAVQADGRILAVGAMHDGNRDSPVLVRLHAAGDIDRGFGRDGMVPLGAKRRLPYARDVTVQGNGRIVVVGVGLGGKHGEAFRALRYLPDGTLDRGFGSGGIQQLSPAGGAAATFTQSDGRVVAAGWLTRRIGDGFETEPMLTRYLPGD